MALAIVALAFCAVGWTVGTVIGRIVARRIWREVHTLPAPPRDVYLFPPAVAEWAAAHSDELSLFCCELEESSAALIEE